MLQWKTNAHKDRAGWVWQYTVIVYSSYIVNVTLCRRNCSPDIRK